MNFLEFKKKTSKCVHLLQRNVHLIAGQLDNLSLGGLCYFLVIYSNILEWATLVSSKIKDKKGKSNFFQGHGNNSHFRNQTPYHRTNAHGSNSYEHMS